MIYQVSEGLVVLLRGLLFRGMTLSSLLSMIPSSPPITWYRVLKMDLLV